MHIECISIPLAAYSLRLGVGTGGRGYDDSGRDGR